LTKTKQKFLFLTLGGVPIYEPNLAPLIKKNISAGRLTFTTDLEKAVKESKVIIYYQFGEAMYIIYLKILFIKNLSNLI
jgi:UDP-glucose 6-dehydrogenase